MWSDEGQCTFKKSFLLTPAFILQCLKRQIRPAIRAEHTTLGIVADQVTLKIRNQMQSKSIFNGHDRVLGTSWSCPGRWGEPPAEFGPLIGLSKWRMRRQGLAWVVSGWREAGRTCSGWVASRRPLPAPCDPPCSSGEPRGSSKPV